MKTKIASVILLILSLNFFTACGGGDNAYDGETGLLVTTSESSAFNSIQTNILVANANELNTTLKILETELANIDGNATDSDITALQESFVDIMKAWKSVQTTYIIGDYNSSLIDTEQLLDFFNTGKNLDVASDIDLALSSSATVENSLFKNSSKSITALEYLTFGNQSSTTDLVALMNTNDKRRIETIKVVVSTIQEHVNDIVNFYATDTQFVSDTTEASNNLVNELVDSAYKLKEQRIGEAAGYVIKYKDDPDASRFEYYKSQKSLEAIKAILTAHNQIMGEQDYENFGSFATDNGASAIVITIRGNIDTSLAIVEEFLTPIESTVSTTEIDEKVQRLFDEVTKLQENYFSSLISSLSLTAQIIEADGD